MRSVAVEELHAHWPAVREQMNAVRARFGERTTPEELYYALRQKLAALYEHNGGYLVLQHVTELDGTVTLFIWLVMGKFADDQDYLLAEVLKIAAGMKAKRLRMRSPRKWERAMKNYWRVYEYLYEHELEPICSVT